MKCERCNTIQPRLIIDRRGRICSLCRGGKATSSHGDMLLTRNSTRVREQHRRYEGDMITAHVYDEKLKKSVPNDDFIKRYADRVDNFFTKQELVDAGYTKIASVFEENDRARKELQKAKDQEVEFKEGEPLL